MGFFSNLFTNKLFADAFHLQGFERDVFFALNSDCERGKKQPSVLRRSEKKEENDRVIICFKRGQAPEALHAAARPEFRGKLICFQLVDENGNKIEEQAEENRT